MIWRMTDNKFVVNEAVYPNLNSPKSIPFCAALPIKHIIEFNDIN